MSRKIVGVTVGTSISPEALKKKLNIGSGESADLTGYATETYVNTAVKKASPRNLLDNSDFRNPVNQRNITSLKPGTTKTYFIDRWCSARSDVSVSNNGLLLKWDGANGTDGYIQQIVGGNWAQGNIVTVSAKVDGEVCSAILTLGASSATVTSFVNENLYFSVAWTSGKLFVTLTTKKVAGVTIKWMSLYEGEYTIDTLPEYQPKGYAAELLECRRYYQRVGQLLSTGAAATGFMFNTTSARFVMSISPMRKINPTVTLVSSASQPSVISNGDILAKGALTFTTNAYADAQHMIIVVTVSGGTKYANAVLMSDKDCYFEISADL